MTIAFNNATRTLTLTGGTSTTRLTPSNVIDDATLFSTGSTYAVGAIVKYNAGGGLGVALYRCTTAVTVAGAFVASNWTLTVAVVGLQQMYVSAFLTIGAFYDDAAWNYSFDYGMLTGGAGVNWNSAPTTNSMIGLGFSVVYNGAGLTAGGHNLLAGATSADVITWGRVRFFVTGGTNQSVGATNSAVKGSIEHLIIDNKLQPTANNTWNTPSVTTKRLDVIQSNLQVNPTGVAAVGHTGIWGGSPFNRIGIVSASAANPLRNFATDLPADLSKNVGIIASAANQYFEDMVVPVGFDWTTMLLAYYSGMSAFFTRSVNIVAKQGGSLLSGVVVYATNDANATVSFSGLTNASGVYSTKARFFNGNRTATTTYVPLDNQVYTKDKTVLFRRRDLDEATYQQDISVKSIDLTQFLSVDAFYTTDRTGLAGIAADSVTKTLTLSASLTIDQIYDWLKLYLELNPSVVKMVNPLGTDLTLINGWSVLVSGVSTVISEGTKLKTLFTSGAGTITISSGKITALYGTATSASARLVFSGLSASSTYLTNAEGAQQDYQSGLTGGYTSYIAPGATGTWQWMATRYGYIRNSSSFSPATGGDFPAAMSWLQDLYITQTTQATVAAYSSLNTLDQVYDYEALSQLSNAGIPYTLLVRNGEEADYGTVNLVVDAAAAQVRSYDVGTNTLTIKATVLAPGTKFLSIKAATITFVNGATATCVYTTNEGMSSIIEITASAGSSVYAGSAAGVTKFFQANIAEGSTRFYLPPGDTSPMNVARELYGYLRKEDTITPTGGIFTFEPLDIPDAGIAEASVEIVLAYTSLDYPSKFYDRTAAFRLTEQGIKLGQIATRSGTIIEHGDFSKIIQDDAAAVYAISGSTITIRASSYEADSRYNKETANPPATITAHDTEIVSISIEDANGDSQAIIAGTVNSLVDVWKITNDTLVEDFATGVKLATGLGNVAYRFIHQDGFQLVFFNRDNGVYRYCSMSKGDYSVGWYLYNTSAGGLTQQESALLRSIAAKNSEIFSDVNSLTTGFIESTDNIHAVRLAIDTLPTLSQIEDSAILAKEASVAAVQKTAKLAVALTASK